MNNKKIAFVTESGFFGKYSRDNKNCRVDVAWQILLDATHIPFTSFKEVKGYDYVFVILPKGDCVVNREGSSVKNDTTKPLLKQILENNLIDYFKQNNKAVCYIQEGPVDYYLDYELSVQMMFLNFISSCDIIFAHNECDTKWYRGLFPENKIEVLQSVMVEDTIKNLPIANRNGVMVGGNMTLWYSGLNGYILSKKHLNDEQIYCPSMHCKRIGEESLGVIHLEYKSWTDWMGELNNRKYAIHLMPTVAAGTFSLNCAYLQIPCIGNIRLDTQRKCFPHTSVDVTDLENAGGILNKLKLNEDFYREVSVEAYNNYCEFFSEKCFIEKMNKILI